MSKASFMLLNLMRDLRIFVPTKLFAQSFGTEILLKQWYVNSGFAHSAKV